MLNYLFYGLIAIMIIWFYYTTFAKVKGLKELDANAFQNELANANQRMLIDVREPFEVKQGAIKGAVNIPLGQLTNRIGEISKEKSVFLYCRSGNRSRQAARILLKSGFEQVTHLSGGIMAWSGELKK